MPGYIATYKNRGESKMNTFYAAENLTEAKKEAKSFFALIGLRLVPGSEIRIQQLEAGQSLELSRRS